MLGTFGKLAGDFWFRVFMVILCSVGFYWGISNENGYAASVSGLWGALSIYGMIMHIRKARLEHGLSMNPEMKRIYDARDNAPD